MFEHAKAEWLEFKHWPAGRRFCLYYEKHKKRDSNLARFLVLFGALVSFVVGVILVFIPGPAILFFAITAALIATQSRPLARYLDGTELWCRRRIASYRRRRARPAGNSRKEC